MGIRGGARLRGRVGAAGVRAGPAGGIAGVVPARARQLRRRHRARPRLGRQPERRLPDPLRALARWNGTRGEVIPIAYRNRYDAKIAGHLWRPKGASGALPAVLFVNGAGAGDSSYFWAAQDLAEHGYLVMTFDPQGAGGSDAEPAARYCEAQGAWTAPQELGIREQGPLAPGRIRPSRRSARSPG